MKAGPAALLMGEHPSFTPERCINRKQRRVVCTRCSDLCPVGVFSLKSGEKLSWDRCVDCGLCAANCPTRCFSLSKSARELIEEESAPGKTLVFACRTDENGADVPVRCLAGLPWELLAVYAMNGRIALRTEACETCEKTAWKSCLEQNLDALRAFLGEQYAERVQILQGGEAPEAADGEAGQAEEERFTRRGLFARAGQTAARTALRAAAERLPFPQETEEDGMRYRRMLAALVKKENAEGAERRRTVSLPQFNTRCTGCGICEKLCPQAAIRIVPEGDGNRLICLTPWKCTACGLCARLCFAGGLSGMHPVAVPRMTELALVRVKPKEGENA